MFRFSFIGVCALVACAYLCTPVRADDAAIPADQATSLANQLQTAINTGNAAAGDALFDRDALVDRATAGIDAPADFASQFRTGVKQGPSVLSSIIKSIGNGAGYHFLRLRQTKTETHALCRLMGADWTPNYNEWVYGKDASGQWKFVDCYTANTGETLSNSLRRVYLSRAMDLNPRLADTLTGEEKSYVTGFARVKIFLEDYRSHKYGEALDSYDYLPAAVQQSKWIMLIRYSASRAVKDAQPQAYTDAVTDFHKSFPDDPCLDLIQIGPEVKDKQYDDALHSLDRLDAYTGGDPYLLYMRGDIFLIEGGAANLALAKQWFQKSSDAEPMLIQPFWGLLTVSTKTQNYDDTSALLTEFAHRFHQPVGDLTKSPDYAGYVKSPQYAAWKASSNSTTRPN